MRRHITLSAFFLSAIICMLAPVRADADAKQSSLENRSIDFHSEQSLGSLSLASSRPDGGHDDPAQLTMGDRIQVGPARGKMNIAVPQNSLLCFEPNMRVFTHPELLEKIGPGIDVLFVQSTSVDDSEDGRADRLLLHIKHMQDLKELYTNRSDATDSAISKLPTLKSLRIFGAFLDVLDGSCLEGLSKQPNINALMLWNTKLNERNLKYLPSMPKLKCLNVADDRLTSVGLSFIGRCTSLTDLFLAWNRRITDEDLRLLLPLKKLEKLDLRDTNITDKSMQTLVSFKHLKWLILDGTKVTPEGIVALRPLHLSFLCVKDHQYNPQQIGRMKEVCPNLQLVKPASIVVDKDMRRLFAPLSRQR